MESAARGIVQLAMTAPKRPVICAGGEKGKAHLSPASAPPYLTALLSLANERIKSGRRKVQNKWTRRGVQETKYSGVQLMWTEIHTRRPPRFAP